MTTEAFPLSWPAGRVRLPYHRREQSNFATSMGKARDALFNEVSLLGGRNVVLSSNVPLRQDGKPYANPGRIDDPAAAIYFTHKGRVMCFACDRWMKVEDNIQAIRKTIEALRGIARWGTGDMLEAAFTGFMALPAPSATRNWWDVLQVPKHSTREAVKLAYRSLASQHHPDKPNGSHQKMAELNAAQEAALMECAT